MDYDELESEIEAAFHPEPDEDGFHREWAHDRLAKKHGFDFSFMETFAWEGSTSHPNTRVWVKGEPGRDELTRTHDIPGHLLSSGLRVYADSLLTYRNKPSPTPLRFYPPAILTFWSGFEAFVRWTSELMIHTSKGLPEHVADFLRDQVTKTGANGQAERKQRFRSTLDRYAMLLEYGFGMAVDRGSKHWQALEQANHVRDYYTHVKAMGSRSITSDEVLDYLEAVLLGILWPSAVVKRTLLLGVHDLYWIWWKLTELTRAHLPRGHAEEPFFHSRMLQGESFLFYCPFLNVDTDRFPTLTDRLERLRPREQTPTTSENQ